jgi:hypothetical protein
MMLDRTTEPKGSAFCKKNWLQWGQQTILRIRENQDRQILRKFKLELDSFTGEAEKLPDKLGSLRADRQRFISPSPSSKQGWMKLLNLYLNNKIRYF